MDPNKYKQNADIQPESLLKTLASVGSMALMVIGIIGIATDFFRDDSWITNLIAYFFQSTSTMLLIPVIAFILWLLNRWISTPNKNEKKKTGNIPMYIMMMIGVYYIYQFLLG